MGPPFDGDTPGFPATTAWTAMVCNSLDCEAWRGTGVLIDERRVLTCDHVAEGDELWVEFPLAEQDDDRRFKVASVLRAPRYDLALLTLEQPPGVAPVPLRHTPASGLTGVRWWAFGFPYDEIHGNDAYGTVGIPLARGFVRLDSHREARYFLRPGCSGGGVWSPEYQAVVAIVVQASGKGDGKAVTIHQAISCFPDAGLDRLTAWTAGDVDEVAHSSWGLPPRTGWNLRDDPETARHWSPRARGVMVDAESGHRFQGRERALKEIVAWMSEPSPDRRVLVVTGSPGVGKSAVLGRIVTTASPDVQLPEDDTAERAKPGSVQCAVHTQGKTALEVAAEIARAASAPLPERLEALAPALRRELTERPRLFTIVIDALDETATPAEARDIITEVILPLARADMTVRLLVGTRRYDDTGNLLEVFGAAHSEIDLDAPDYFAVEDLAAYAKATLQQRGAERPGNPYADDSTAAAVAARIAALSERNFLVAGLIAKSHGLYDTEPADPDALTFTGQVEPALQALLHRIPPVRDVPAAAVLTALAFAYPPGLPSSLWRVAVAALTGTELTEEDLTRFARSSAANFLVETASGQAYRLFHQALNDVLLAARAERAPYTADQRALTVALYAYGQEIGWDNAPPYLLRSLPAHAADGERLDDLLDDAEYLLYADLARVLTVGDYATTRSGRDRVRLLRLTPQTQDAAPGERIAMLSVTETMEKTLGSAFHELGRARPVLYDADWASCLPRLELAVLGHTGAVNAVCALPAAGGHTLLAAASDESVLIWDPATATALHTLVGHTSWVTAVCALPGFDGHCLLATASHDETVRIWDPATATLLRTLSGHSSWVTTVCALPGSDGRTLLAAASDESVVIWDPATGSAVRTLTGHSSWVNAVCTLPGPGGRSLLVTASEDETVRIWDPVSGDTLHTLVGHTDSVNAVCTLPGPLGHTLLATASDDETVRIWDPVTATPLHTLTGHTDWVTAVCTLPGAHGHALLATAGSEGTVRIWDPATAATLHTLTGHTDWVRAVCALPGPDGHTLLATASDDETVRIWDPQTVTTLSTLTGHTGSVNAVCALGGSLVSASDDETVRLWDPASGSTWHTLAGHTDSVNAVCALPGFDGQTLLASASKDESVRIWDPVNGATLHTLAGHASWVRAVCALPVADGHVLLATASIDRTVRLWDPATGTTLRTLAGHTGWVNAVCTVAGPDGETLLATASEDETVRVWDPMNGTTLHQLVGHTSAVTAVCTLPGPSGQNLLATASRDHTLRLWDLNTAKTVHVLTGHTSSVTAVCALPAAAGRILLATASVDRTIRVWDVEEHWSLGIPVHHAALGIAALPDGLAVGLSAGVIVIKLNYRAGGMTA
jgi:WD40 repeat protein